MDRKLNALRKYCLERTDAPAQLSDTRLKEMIPLYVKGDDETTDHKCSTCRFRVEGQNACAIMAGRISLPHGVCSYWAEGPPTPSSEVEYRMSQTTAGYVEHKGPINCHSCAAYMHDAEGRDYCRLWKGTVHDGDCCSAWSPNSDAGS